MAKQTFANGVVLYGPVTAGQVSLTDLQANDYNQTVSTKTASYVLVAADAGTRVVMNLGSATTITVNTSLFTAGDTLFIQNIGAGACTITAGTATVTTSGSLVLAQWAGGLLYFTSTGAAIFFPSGGATATTSRVRLHTHNGYGSTSTMIPRFTTTVVNSGSDITYADSATLGSTFTINTAGMYAVGFCFGGADGTLHFNGLSLNSSQLSTSILSITAADRLAIAMVAGVAGDMSESFVGCTMYFAVNDVIRPHTNAAIPLVAARTNFTIVRLN